MDPADRLCKICSIQERRYVCPRCGIPYCSLKCYQNLEKHVKCSESFYRDCVVESIEEEKDPLKAKKMQEVLQRFHDQYDNENEEEDEDFQDSDDDEPLAKRLEGIDLNDSDEVWNSLTLEEREEFKRFVHQNEGKDIIPEWTPWWTQPAKNTLIQEVEEGDSLESLLAKGHKEKLNDDQPDILDPIPTMASLTKVKPNDTVKLGLTNIIGAYVWTARLFSGDIANPDEPEEVAFALITLSSALSNDQVFTLYQDAVSDVSFNACKNPDLLDGGPSLQQHLNKDVLLILRGGAPELPVTLKQRYSKSFVFSVLSECYKLFYQLVSKARKVKASEIVAKKKAAAASISSNSGTSESFSKLFPKIAGRYAMDPNMYKKALRKVHYLLAFVNEFDIW